VIRVDITIESRSQLASVVRPARAADAPALAALVNRAYEVEQAFVTGDRTSADEIAELIDDGVFLVLEHAGVPAAAVHVDTTGAEAVIRMLSVHPELQGMGLGKRLLGIGEALCEAAGCVAVRLQIVNLREELSRWYRGLGYRVVGRSPFEARTKLQDCHFVDLRKPLSVTLVA
jgi:ribosomal protein S18 acetylase RimI-like enzyme